MCELTQTARSLLVSERSSFLHEDNRVSEQMQQLHYNYKVCVLLPGCTSLPSHLDSAVQSFSSFYLIRNLPVHQLLDKEFLEKAVYQGSVYGLSYRTRIDEDNCVALMPNGRLCLSLDKDSFELLGIEGKPSKFNHRAKSRYVVSVDLTDSSWSPGGRSYERLVTGLKTRLQLTTDFLLSHHPGGVSSLQSLLPGCDWSEHRPAVTQRALYGVSLPLLTCQSGDSHSFLEWLGATHADVNCEKSSSEFLSSLEAPEPNTPSDALSVCVSGLLLPQDIHTLLQEIRSYLSHSPAPWASLTVHGFTDSPVSWATREHSALTGGENFYSVQLFRDQSYRIHLGTGAYDSCPP